MAAPAVDEDTRKVFLLVGTYSPGDADASTTGTLGVFGVEGSGGDVSLTKRDHLVVGHSPSFFVWDGKDKLYTVNETETYKGDKTGYMSVVRLGREGDKLCGEVVSRTTSRGETPAYVSLSVDHDAVFVANYSDTSSKGTTVGLALDKAGAFACEGAEGKAGEGVGVSVIEHVGAGKMKEGVHAPRQVGPHAHCATLGPDGRFLYSADLGTDRVLVLKVGAGGALTYADEADADGMHGVDTGPATGPRHAIFHPTKPLAYIVTELQNTVIVMTLDRDTGLLSDARPGVSTLPEGDTGLAASKSPIFGPATAYAAHLSITQNGKFLIVSNRGHDSLSVLSTGDDGATLSLMSTVPTEGLTPRGMVVDEGAGCVYVVHQHSNDLRVLTFNSDTGALALTATKHDVGPAPNFLAVVRV